MKNEAVKLLIADAEGLGPRRLADYVNVRGFEARIVTNVRDARRLIDEWQPRFVLADLMLADGGALNLIDHVRLQRKSRPRSIGVIVTSAHNVEQNVRQTVGRGARDYIVKPFTPDEVYRRLVHHVRGHRALSADVPLAARDESGLMLELTDLVLQQALRDTDLEEILFNLTRMVNLRFDGVRCSLVHCVDPRTGVVVVSNDDREASAIRLDLKEYPEIQHVFAAQSSLAIEDLDDTAELRAVRARVRDISFDRLIVSPVSRNDRPFGVLSLRLPEGHASITDHEIRFVEIAAKITSLVLNGRRHQAFRDFWDRPDPRGILNFPFKNEG